MPKRTDIDSILVIGAGPIVIGQAAEFDYSGTQAIKALKAEGYRVILVNSNPATIMTDPEMADATYIEPVTPEMVEKIIEIERPDALLPTVGGQTGLNTGVALAESGVLEKYGVRLIGANLEAIKIAEDRELFKQTMEAHGLRCPAGGVAHSLDEAVALAKGIGKYPILIRASFTLGGTGGSVAYDEADFREKVEFGLRQSPVGSVLIDESVLGWKEYELEVMRDHKDNFVVVCSIENIDAMGVHTGDSITVAPALTLTDREYQRLRDMAKVVMRAVGVETGGSNVQFAINPETGEVLIVEMNPRVSRSSALASKATGFPIAKLAALLAVGYTLDEVQNDITRETVAAFEPSIDYVVTKLPRWAFEKFPGVDPVLGPQMKSVGEAMSIGRTFKESLLKGLASLELARPPYPTIKHSVWNGELESLREPNDRRMWAVWEAVRAGHTVEEVCEVTSFDSWFVAQLAEIVSLEQEIAVYNLPETLPYHLLKQAKRCGFTDGHIAYLLNLAEFPATGAPDREHYVTAQHIRELRHAEGLLPTYHVVDTCAAEFESYTPYLYSSYETESEAPPSDREKVIILGGGPNRIGQGIEFDYCCVHAAMSLREMGYEAIMVNCNPETVSTDYDTSDRLYFEPLTFEHVLNICEREQPLKGVIVQFGGQTPLKLARGLEAAGIPILGTTPESIDLAEDRGRFGDLLKDLHIFSPPGGIAHSIEEARSIAHRIGFPVLVRPSYVLGGRGMVIVYTPEYFDKYVKEAFEAVEDVAQSVLVDHYVQDSFELDVDAICDGERVIIGGVMQHIEEAGVHSGDSACVIPPYGISNLQVDQIRRYTRKLAAALGVKGLMNIQFAIEGDRIYVLEANPRASRTVPYVSKATGVPLAKYATQILTGKTLEEIGLTEEPRVDGYFIKEAVLPFKKFTGIDAQLGPEMRSTGEVMGHAGRFGHAFVKAQMAAGDTLPINGAVCFSVNDNDKQSALQLAGEYFDLGFKLIATEGTAKVFEAAGLPVERVNKLAEGSPNIVDLLKSGDIVLLINTPLGLESYTDGRVLRSTAVRLGVPLITTLSAGWAAVNGVRALREKTLSVRSLQTHYRLQV